MLGKPCLVFFLGCASQTMPPWLRFPFFDFFECCLAWFQILVKLSVAAVCARRMQGTCVENVMGFHTIREPPCIFGKKSGAVIYAPTVQITINQDLAQK